MSEHVAFKETDAETGVTLKIIQDPDAESPLSWDEAVIFAVLHRQYENPAEKHGLTSVEAIVEFEEANAADDSEWVVFPLFMYDHSGTVYRASHGGNPFSCPWDSGRVGIIAMKRADVGEDPFKAAELTCKVYTDWANGNAWGYAVEGPDDEQHDSCWGFVGDHDEEYLMSEARAAFEDAKAKARKDKAGVIRRQGKIAAMLAENGYGQDDDDESARMAAIMVRLAKGEADAADLAHVVAEMADLEDA